MQVLRPSGGGGVANNPRNKAPHMDTSAYIGSHPCYHFQSQFIFTSTMVEQPVLHSDIYPAVDPKNFVGSQKGKVVLIIGM